MHEGDVSVIVRIVDLGREYRFLEQALRATQNRLLAYLVSKHEKPSHAWTTLDEPLSQADVDTLAADVPSWLRKPPTLKKRMPIAQADWHPERFLVETDGALHIKEKKKIAHPIEAGPLLSPFIDRMLTTLHVYRGIFEQYARQLPVWAEWASAIRGIDAYGLARIIAEAADLWRYPTVASLWKRMGVGLHQGKRQQRKAKVSMAEAMAIGYVPRRRAIVYNLQVGLINQNKTPEGLPLAYRQCYLDRKGVEEAKEPTATKMVWHRRASRYMAKRFLRDLWIAWQHTMPPTAVALTELKWGSDGGPWVDSKGQTHDRFTPTQAANFARRLRQAETWQPGGCDQIPLDIQAQAVAPPGAAAD